MKSPFEYAESQKRILPLTLSPRPRYTGEPFQSLSPKPVSPTKSDIAHRLREEIAQTALNVELQKKTPFRRPYNDAYPTSRPDSRSEKNEKEAKRKEALRRRNYEAVRVQLEEKHKEKEKQDTIRRQERLSLEQQMKVQERDREQEMSQQMAQAQRYRQTLDLQRQLKKVTEKQREGGLTVGRGRLPSDINQLAFDLPEFRHPAVYTYHHPKPVLTDPITFATPRIGHYYSDLTSSSSHEDDRFKKSMTRNLSDYGHMILRNFAEPVNDKHAGLNYRDTRSLIQ